MNTLAEAPEHIKRVLAEHAGSDLSMMNRMLKRVQAGDPVEYVLGHQDFMGRRYLADRRAYIAQADSVPFINMVAHECLTLYQVHGPLTVCEVGTGSGVLSIHLACLSDALERDVIERIVSTDIDGAALRLARDNVELHQQSHKITLLESDLLTELEPSTSFHLVFAYPPWGDRSPDDLHYPGSEWETFHQTMPPISCYPVGGDYAVHEGILVQAATKFPSAAVIIFNDYLPSSDAQLLASRHSAEVIPCGEGMTALRRAQV